MIDDDHDQSDKEIFIRKSVSIRKKQRRYDQFHKTDNIILSEKYEKQVYSTSDEEGFQSIDELDDDELDLEDYDLPLNDDKLFAAPSLANPNYNSDQKNNIDINDLWILLWIRRVGFLIPTDFLIKISLSDWL